MKKILSISLIFCSLLGAGQNLVPNPSFEDTLPNPNWNAVLDQACSEWQTPGPGTTDYYCDNNPLSPGSASVYITPKSGVSFAGIYVYKPSWQTNAREILTVKLLDTLVEGQEYEVSFYVCRGYFPNYACDNIGAYFSAQPITTSFGVCTYTAQIQNPITNSLVSKVDWLHVSGVFTASGDELYMTIANFRPDSLSSVTWIGDGYQLDSSSYYYVDDVSVTTYVEPPDTIFPFAIFPNPSGGNFELTGVFPEGTELKIYNALGQAVCETISIPEGSHRISIVLDLAAGTYLFKLECYGEMKESGKLVVE